MLRIITSVLIPQTKNLRVDPYTTKTNLTCNDVLQLNPRSLKGFAQDWQSQCPTIGFLKDPRRDFYIQWTFACAISHGATIVCPGQKFLLKNLERRCFRLLMVITLVLIFNPAAIFVKPSWWWFDAQQGAIVTKWLRVQSNSEANSFL